MEECGASLKEDYQNVQFGDLAQEGPEYDGALVLDFPIEMLNECFPLGDKVNGVVY